MSGSVQEQLGRFLLGAGVVLVILGFLVLAGSRISFWGFGRLPGDVAYKGKHFQVYFPIVTCVILSVVVTLIMWIISLLTRR
jgi:hypothetical protein